MRQSRPVICSLVLAFCMSGCGRSTSSTEPRGDTPVVSKSGAIDSGQAVPVDQKTSLPEKKSPLAQVFPKPLATAAAGLDLEAIAARRLHLESLMSQYGGRLAALDAGTSLGEDTIHELRRLGPIGIIVTLASPHASAEQVSIGRKHLLNKLTHALDAKEPDRANPDPTRILEQLQPMLHDKSEAGEALLLYWLSLPYAARERVDYFRALRTLMRDSPHIQVRRLALGSRMLAENESGTQYLKALRQAIGVPEMEDAVRPEYASELFELGPNASLMVLSKINNWKLESQTLLDREKQGQLARDRRRRSSYLTRRSAAYAEAAELGGLGEIPRDVVLGGQIEDLESAFRSLQIGRGERLRMTAEALGLPFDNTLRETDRILAESARLTVEVGRYYLRRGRPEAALEAFHDFLVYSSGGKYSPIDFARSCCGVIVTARARNDLDHLRGYAGDATQSLSNAELGPFDVRAVAIAAITQTLSDILQHTGQSQDAVTLVDEIDERIKGEVDSIPGLALERYLIGAELWCDAAEFEIAQASLEKVASSIDTLVGRDPRRAAQLLVRMGEAQLSRDRYADAIPHFARAIELAKSAELSDFVAEVTVLLAFAHASSGNATEATELLVSVSKNLGTRQSLATLATIDLTIGQLLLQEQDVKGAQPFLASTVAVLEQECSQSHFLSRRAKALLSNGPPRSAPPEASHSDRLAPRP